MLLNLGGCTASAAHAQGQYVHSACVMMMATVLSGETAGEDKLQMSQGMVWPLFGLFLFEAGSLGADAVISNSNITVKASHQKNTWGARQLGC
jgi:hypothetical protein